MILIGISGKKGSGKDLVADTIAKQLHPTTCSKIGFADALYEEVAYLIWKDVSPLRIRENIQYIKEHKDNFRKILQGYGTDYKRQLISKTYWIEELMRRCIKNTSDCIVVNDVRFQDEADYIKEMGGILIRLVRATGSTDTHESEIALDTYGKFDYVITNDGSIEELESQVKIFLAKLLRNK